MFFYNCRLRFAFGRTLLREPKIAMN